MPKLWKLTFASLLLLIILIALAAFPFFDSRVHLVFCDVGQGDGILIYQKQTQILIDAGPDKKILSCLGKHLPFWDRKIELAMITNADLDHYGGFIDIVRSYQIGEFAIPDVGKSDLAFEALEKEVEAKKIKVVKVFKGNKLKVGEMEFKILWPQREDVDLLSSEDNKNKKVLGEHVTPQSPNELSLVSLFTFGTFNALLTGDIEPQATNTIADNLTTPVEVLKVPHHGSKNGLTAELLNSSKPKVAIISAGRKNRFGHPHKETLKLLNDQRIKILGTYEKGEIEVVTDGREWGIK